LQLGNIKYTLDGNQLTYADAADNDFRGEKYGLKINLGYELVARTGHRNSLISAAYAFKCAGEEYIPDRDITSVKINTLADFNSSHPTNSDVTEYFKQRSFDNKGKFAGFVPIPEVQRKERYTDTPYFDHVVFLDALPDMNRIHQFEVTIYFSDSTTMIGKTDSLILK
jgi:hypothetical protein